MRTADMAKRRFAALFDPEDVTFQQYNVLRILRGAGPQGLPTLEIGERMIERTPGVTRIVDRLVSKGWVERERCTEDRRKVWCRITPSGRALLARLDEPVARADRELFDGFGDEALTRFIGTMDELRGRMDERLGEEE
ncbi:MAG: MarR family transcriptional regulator [Gemmatimonadota bacterium]